MNPQDELRFMEAQTALLDRIGYLERKCRRYDTLIDQIMTLMASHPAGRSLLKHMDKVNRERV